MKLGATLYIKNSREAVDFYREAFGLELGYHEMNPDGTYLHAALTRDGNEIFAVSESQNDSFLGRMLQTSLTDRPTMSYGIDFPNEEELRKAYAMLIEGGTILFPIGALPWCACAADVVDKYGVYWYICI
jgi:PhnB protein